MMAVIQQMDQEEPEEVSEWRKLKHSLAVNKPLVPLKFTMLLIYGGKLSLGVKLVVFRFNFDPSNSQPAPCTCPT